MQTETRGNDGRQIMPVPQGATAAMPRAGEPPAPAPQRDADDDRFEPRVGLSAASSPRRLVLILGEARLTTHGEFSRGADSRGVTPRAVR